MGSGQRKENEGNAEKKKRSNVIEHQLCSGYFTCIIFFKLILQLEKVKLREARSYIHVKQVQSQDMNEM